MFTSIASTRLATFCRVFYVCVLSKVLIIKEGACCHYSYGQKISEVFLLDFVLHYSYIKEDKGKELLCCSNIYEGAESNNNLKVYVLKDKITFLIFKENFNTLWDFDDFLSERDSFRINEFKTTNLFDLIKNQDLDETNIDWDNIISWLANLGTRTQKQDIMDKLTDFKVNIDNIHEHTQLKTSFSNIFNSYISPQIIN